MVVGSTVVDDDNGIWRYNRLSSNDTVAWSDSILMAILSSADTMVDTWSSKLFIILCKSISTSSDYNTAVFIPLRIKLRRAFWLYFLVLLSDEFGAI